MKTPPQATNGHPAVLPGQPCDFGSLDHNIHTCPKCRVVDKALPEKPHVSLYTEPTADILILGEMMVASNAQADFLKKLAKSGSEYRGYLYQIKAAAIRVSGLANKLLEEAK